MCARKRANTWRMTEYGTLWKPQRDTYEKNTDYVDETVGFYENTTIHVLLSVVHGCFGVKKAELSNYTYNKVHLGHKDKSIYLILHRKCLQPLF